MLCYIVAVLSCVSLIGGSTVPCICTMDYTPVCGVDGKTYGNKCGLDCAGVQLDYQGECQKPATQAVHHVCACPRIYMPVCGQNGVTYANQCEMNCAGVAFFQNGTCTSVPAGAIHKRAVTPCICTFIYRPVCGSDGVTYGNECNLDCAAKSATATGSTPITKVADMPCSSVSTTTTTKSP